MLACSTIPAWEDIKFPVIASFKLDGFRCVLGNGIPFTRNMKQLANKFVRRTLMRLKMHGLDGELMVDGGFEKVQSVFTSHYHAEQTKFYFNVFDCFNTGSFAFKHRTAEALAIVQRLRDPRIRFVEQQWIGNLQDLRNLYDTALLNGYEGLIIRDPESPYKQGRSTLKQGWMLKLKPFIDDEAMIMGFTELEHNEDASNTTKQENMVLGGTLGALIVSWNAKQFKIGSGFSLDQRDEIWQNKEKYLSKKVTFKYQNLTKYGIPRFPIYKGMRPEND